MQQCGLACARVSPKIRRMIRFSLFGVRVSISPSLWLTLAVLGGVFNVSGMLNLLGVALFIIAALLCLLTHEMGHALVGRSLGGGQPEVCLAWLGGACNHPDAVLTRTQGVVMTAAGPAASVLLGLFAIGALGVYVGSLPAAGYIALHAVCGSVPAGTWELGAPLAILFFVDMICVSFWWSVFNLLPVFPLDGGQMMHGLSDSPRRMHFVSLVCACVLVALFFVLGLWPLCLLMGALAFLNYRCLQQAPY